MRPAPAEGPLVPVDSAASRSLIAVIAILTFLAALCAGAAELVATNSAQWRASVANEATIQIRPQAPHDTEALVAQAAALARATPGIVAAEPFSLQQSERLLEPWLGSGLDLGELPVPRLIVLRIDGDSPPDLGALRAVLRDEVPGASLDDHAQWLARLSAMAQTIVAIGAGVVALVIVATGLAVAFATRGAMAGNMSIVEVLHYVGARDSYIALEFRRRFLRLGLKGGVMGGAAAIAVFGLLSMISSAWRASPSGDQIEALFGAFELGLRGYAIMGGVALVVALVTALVSGFSVRRFLAEHP
ncbi:MAG: ABC transporter permease [Salinarimonadaceae bacterium]|nr:MAG: ABC transporter permease [Salinarimonadaceae bacterium]